MSRSKASRERRRAEARARAALPASETMHAIPPADLPRMVGQPIHLAWAKKGCVWILRSIEGDTLHLETPKTGRRSTAAAKDACYVRRLAPAEDCMP